MGARAPRSHTPKGRLARERLLDAAEELFGAHGWSGASLRDVAARAKIPLASMVYHFAKKEALYAAVLDRIASDLEAVVLHPAVAPSFRSWDERLDAIVSGLVTFTEETPGRARLLVRELLDNPPRVARASRFPLAPLLGRLVDFVEDGVAEGAFVAPRPVLAVLHVVGAITYVAIARPTVKRIVGAPRDASLAASGGAREEALSLARRAFGVLSRPAEVDDGSSNADRPRPARARARRGKNDRHGRRADHPRD